MTTAPTSDFFANLGTLIKDDALTAFAAPLISYLQAVQSANADPLKLQLATMALIPNLAAAAPGAEAMIISQLAGSLITKLQALEAQAANPPS